MKIAVLSDVHANNAALKAVLDDAAAQQCETYWCLGDITGRGPRMLQTTETLHALYQNADPAGWLSGNHDLIVTGRIAADHFVRTLNTGDPRITSLTGTSEEVVMMAEHHRKILHSARNHHLREWIEGLPTHSRPLPHFYLAHGFYAINRNDGVVDEAMTYREYTWFGTQVMDQIKDLRNYADQWDLRAHGPRWPHVIAVGHTHVSTLWRWKRGADRPTMIWGWDKHMVPEKSREEVFGRGENQIELHFDDLDAAPLFFNPGSVGFPRGHDRCPTYVILTVHSPTKVTVEFRDVPYDWRPLIGEHIAPWYPQGFRDEIRRTELKDGSDTGSED